ncbi:hypothetical protein FCU94_00380 [Vibrio sp. JPW-9-11-11]|uniref:hypothetical protein n=1 Tax=Vibrio sp. JPW-9-11-11 TaxID=1416532 RepID=UPI001592CDD5|nr:hypothetical protein [Vibrio sp. JPW-9-11-11]NVD05375.1 hypothetical protein [Vibrio sp. JPW-9-11-11]
MPVCHSYALAPRSQALQRLIYVYSHFQPNQEEFYFPFPKRLCREGFIGLLAQAQRAEPIGHELAVLLYLQKMSLADIAKQAAHSKKAAMQHPSELALHSLEQQLEAFVVYLIHLCQKQESL